MRTRTFRQGVHPPEEKELSKDKKIERIPPPPQLIIPLSQHTGAPCRPLVEKKEKVEEGQKIGDHDAFISCPVHSSLSGEVISIEKSPHPTLGEAEAIIIKPDEKDKKDWPTMEVDLSSLSPENIRKKVREAGIAGMGGAAFPTHVKLSPPPGKNIDSVILNGCECEPYLTADYRLMMEKAEECLFGLRAIMKTVEAKKAYIGIEDNKKDTIHLMQKTVEGEDEIEVVPLKTKYPQGGEKMLIKAILGREVPSGGLPFDVGVVVNNVGTAFAIFEAIKKEKPLIERVITVTGRGVERPSNLLVPIGTPLRHILNYCGLKENAKAVIIGGPMMGIAQFSLDTPVIKGTSGVLVLTEDEIVDDKERPCIRCSRCVDHCPVGLLPTILAKLVKAERWESLKEFNIMDCIECGCCTYVCPSKIPIVQLIKWGKNELRKVAS
ncbi:electron transport complex subunit RsxC [Candidatus Aerophobetes bacterium]|uniref:Ion-translocating oxidoreductase complex subunit C n=1 Tax=Aerophobetes bacterium TaxID=2030807 RepID=A0A662DET2_UNCAE|nr:MAG: electron transport complex subunit RsxC [Candidatus Aerophobetes bacterium]